MLTDQTPYMWTELLQSPPPAALVRKRTWFNITGNETSEVDNSQWYRYYLDPNEDHGLKTLFVDTLLDLAGKPFSLQNFTVSTEVGTTNGKRIDILIDGVGPDLGKTIIIENKIYHTLENNLDEYWNHRNGENGKLGVLLTLSKEPKANCRQFSNILHLEWINAVSKRIEEIELSPEQKHYLGAFLWNIRNLTQHTYMNEHVSFFVKNTDLVNRAAACKDETVKYITHQLSVAAKHLNMDLGRTDSPRLRDFIMREVASEVYLSVIFDELLTTKQELRIVLGLTTKNLNKVSDLDQEFRARAEQQGFLLNHYPGNGWHNYLTCIYKLEEHEWKNLDEFIVSCIRDQFFPISIEIGNHLKNQTSQLISVN